MTHKHPLETRLRIVALVRAGKSYREVGRALGMGPESVRYISTRAGVLSRQTIAKLNGPTPRRPAKPWANRPERHACPTCGFLIVTETCTACAARSEPVRLIVQEPDDFDPSDWPTVNLRQILEDDHPDPRLSGPADFDPFDWLTSEPDMELADPPADAHPAPAVAIPDGHGEGGSAAPPLGKYLSGSHRRPRSPKKASRDRPSPKPSSLQPGAPGQEPAPAPSMVDGKKGGPKP
jgi:hypothetical protein